LPALHKLPTEHIHMNEHNRRKTLEKS